MLKTLVLPAVFLLATSCDGDPAASPDVPDAGPPPPTQTIAEQLGLTQYVGAITPIEESVDGDVTTYTFDPAEGPLCMRGAEYRMSVRDLPGSDDLVIFLQGGGACWSAFCLAVTAAPPGIPGVDILNRQVPGNPVADWDVVYLPYCDGSMFAGEAEHDDNRNGNGKRIHRGLANLTAALEVAAMRFPDATRILLAGSSGGAYGLLLGGPMVRHYYPNAELIVMADSGIGLAKDGDQAFLDNLMEEFNVARFLPADCPSCTDRAHLTGLVGWFLGHDDNARVGMFSSWYDSVIARTFLGIPSEDHAISLEAQTELLRDAYPDRFRRFIVDGVQHTSLLGDATGIIGTDLTAVELPPDVLGELLGGDLVIEGINDTAVDGLTMAEWLAALIANDLDSWVDAIAQRGDPPVYE